MLPYERGPVVARRRRGDPTPAEMQLLSQCVKTHGSEAADGTVTVKHPQGAAYPPLLTLAFEMVERGWLVAPESPVVVNRVRNWTFTLTDSGRKAYVDQMSRFGVKS